MAPGIHWLGGCGERDEAGEVFHASASTYLVLGAEKTLLFDTGAPTQWYAVEGALDAILGDRPLDIVVPSHQEVPHSGNLPGLFAKYPALRALGDVRDYHIFYPTLANRFDPWPKYAPIPLGGGYEFTVLDAPIKDLVTTTWGYESSHQVMCVADALAYVHHPGDFEEPVHKPGECRSLSSELPAPPEVFQAMRMTRSALAWTRYMDANQVVAAMLDLMKRYPVKLVAPTHGNVIDELDKILPIIREAYTLAYRGQSDPTRVATA